MRKIYRAEPCQCGHRMARGRRAEREIHRGTGAGSGAATERDGVKHESTRHENTRRNRSAVRPQRRVAGR